MHRAARPIGQLLLLTMLLATLLPWLNPTPALAAEVNGTFRDVGYGDFTARTMDGALSYFFPLPGGQAPQEGSRIELIFSHSPLLVPDRSTMTVVANNQSLTSIFLTQDNRDRARLVVPLPTANFQGTGFLIQVQFHLRLTKDECEETTNAALWATVHGDSRLVIATQASAEGPGLEDVTQLFAPPATPQALASPAAKAPTLAIALPQNPAPEDLEAAGIAAFGAGQWGAAADRDPIIEVNQRPAANRPAIIVGSGATLPDTGDLPARWNGQGFTTTAGDIPAAQGALAIGQTPAGAPRLVIGGGTPATTRSAALALIGPERKDLLQGSAVAVTGATAGGPAPAAAWSNGAASFAQLGFERRQFAGPGEHTIDMAIERPAGWILQPGTTLELAIEASPALRPTTSWVAVTVNGYDVGSHKLDGDERGRYKFTLPADLLNTDGTGGPVRRLALQARFFLDVPQNGCTSPAAPESAWAAILPTSSWTLPHTDASGLDLARFPYPMTGTTKTKIAVVLPQEPTVAELSAGLTVLAAIGRHTPGAVAADRLPRLVEANHLSEADRNASHLILIGGPERNAQSAAAVKSVSDLFTLADPAVYRPGDGGQRGILRLTNSPFGSGNALLAVGGNSPEGMALAANALLQSATLGQLTGKAAVVVGTLGPQQLAAPDNQGTAPAALAPQVRTPVNERLKTWQVIGAIGFGALFMAIALLVGAWLRRRRTA